MFPWFAIAPVVSAQEPDVVTPPAEPEPVVAAPAAPEATPIAEPVADVSDDGPLRPVFAAGTYGRVQASTDLRGGGGDALNVASHAPRLEQGSYLELDLAWNAALSSGAAVAVVATPALGGDLFHYDGQFGDDLSLRNLYAEIDRFVPAPVSVWAGSRMYRGDDLYLLDFWPLDNLNTYGGGARLHPGGAEIAVHVGVNRLTGDEWQYQEVAVATNDSVSGETVLFLDRQRTVASLKAAQQVPLGKLTLRAKLYGELHTLPAGERFIEQEWSELELEALPDDRGSTVGGQLSLWGWAPQSFVHVWVRRSTGLGAYGELAIPADGLDDDYRARRARQLLTAINGNTETRWFGVMAGGYLSYFVDADGEVYDWDDRWELVGVVRPTVYVTDHVAIAGEASHQWVRPNGLNPRSGLWDQADVTKLSVLPGVQVARGGYARPRVQLVYTATLLDAEARDYFSPFDARLDDGRVQHFVGLGAEWWVNSQREVTPE